MNEVREIETTDLKIIFKALDPDMSDEEIEIRSKIWEPLDTPKSGLLNF